LPDWRPNIDYRIGVSSNKLLGGGVLLELSHEIDYLRWIFGDIKWVRSWFGNVSNLELDVEDTAFLLFGIKKFNSNNEIVASLNMDFVRRDVSRTCTVIGDNGSIKWNAVIGTVEVYSLESKSWNKVLIKNEDILYDTYKKQWEYFKNTVENKSESFNSGYDGLEVIKVIEAARISQKNYGIQHQL
jgi:predicted dehydrogenase